MSKAQSMIIVLCSTIVFTSLFTDICLQIFVEPVQGVGPRFSGGLRVKPLSGVVEEGVVRALEHLHFVRFAGGSEGFFQFGFLGHDALVFCTVNAQYGCLDVGYVLQRWVRSVES